MLNELQRDSIYFLLLSFKLMHEILVALSQENLDIYSIIYAMTLSDLFSSCDGKLVVVFICNV